MLYRLRLFGSENNDYSVTLRLKQTGTKLTLAHKAERLSSKLFQYANGNYYGGFEVLLASAAECKKNTKHEIEAVISAFLWTGNSAVCSGVTFTFTDNANCSNGTCTRAGQFLNNCFLCYHNPVQI